MKANILTALSLFLLSYISDAQPGSLDQSFGNGGKVTANLSPLEDFSKAIKVSSDNEIFVGGVTLGPPASFFTLSKYKQNGHLDSSFGKDGVGYFSPFVGSPENCNALLIQPDKKIIWVGNNNYQWSTLIRFLPNGTVDSSFGVNGVRYNFLPAETYRIKQQKDGKIITASVSGGGLYEVVLARFNTNGRIDSTFGNNGITQTQINVSTGPIGLEIQEDDKLLVASAYAERMALFRFTKNGKLDSTFSADGITSYLYSPGNGYFHQGKACSIVIQSDKKIVIGGTATQAGKPNNIALVRFYPDGEIDRDFGSDGIQILSSPETNYYAIGYSMLLQKDDKIVTGGSILYGGLKNFVVARFTREGLVDSSFGTSGVVQTDFDNSDDNCYAIDQQPDGKIVACGYSQYLSSYDSRYAISRYNNDIVLPFTLASFIATKKQNSILLNWQTASETNNSYFAIERSNNSNTNFKEIARVNSKGNSSQTQQYGFEDITPLKGANYYRLKQIDKNGKVTTSKIVLVDFINGVVIKLYPNPVKTNLNIEGLTGSTTTLSIIDVNGKVLSTTSTTNTTYNWNITALPAGNYYLRIEADKKITSMKFVKD
jgi:uncharacterized delta-60 repeat protein